MRFDYKSFIEDNFLIDDAKTGQVIPFKFNKVQSKYYELLTEYEDFERLREIILKARREGFTSLILALFAADMILSEHPRTYLEISYKDDATKQHFQRFKRFLENFYQKEGKSLAEMSETDNKHEIVLKHNKARFYVGTASAKTGERGGTVHRLLFTEAAHFPNTEIMTADEIINASMRMVDIDGGWIFVESTANGKGNTYEAMWQQAEGKLSRFKSRFFGWEEFYTPEEFKLISSEFTDKEMIKQEYPKTAEEAFLASGSNFTTSDKILGLIGFENNFKKLIGWMDLQKVNYIQQAQIIKAWLQGLEKEYHQRNLYVGIDVGKQDDRTVVTVLSDRIFGNGVRCVAIDSTGIGDFMPDWFEGNARWYLERIKFSAQQKDSLYKNLTQVIENRLTELPKFETEESERFFKEMIDLQVERKGDIIIANHPKGNYHDDYPDSWALAEWGYSKINGMPKTREIPEAPVNKINQLLNRQGSYEANPTQYV